MRGADVEIARIVMAADVFDALGAALLDKIRRGRVGDLEFGVAGGPFPFGEGFRQSDAAALMIEPAHVGEERVVREDVSEAELGAAPYAGCE
jgi:hypothetical protein